MTAPSITPAWQILNKSDKAGKGSHYGRRAACIVLRDNQAGDAFTVYSGIRMIFNRINFFLPVISGYVGSIDVVANQAGVSGLSYLLFGPG